ncbi:Homeobox domain-containing protein [Caenorhabditis elegans]|uniref:Homeobox domain-containing protein n=1 Tax=Caenorhabditis elegans TaxID=6239 RepID=O76560_CAEEL|nr:Homeobox domain-containing protein [Caenorhabditis elegans]CCD67124.1 Homeobox domain-containing protein [Caenorhabditis elegans]|eukprot:NP_494148.1 C. Elegans Homeobox [Caenorhabditis elegans]
MVRIIVDHSLILLYSLSAFEESKYISSEEQMQISEYINVDDKIIQRWFEIRRAPTQESWEPEVILPEAIAIFEKEFTTNPNPCSHTLEELRMKTHVQVDSINKWFDERRCAAEQNIKSDSEGSEASFSLCSSWGDTDKELKVDLKMA